MFLTQTWQKLFPFRCITYSKFDYENPNDVTDKTIYDNICFPKPSQIQYYMLQYKLFNSTRYPAFMKIRFCATAFKLTIDTLIAITNLIFPNRKKLRLNFAHVSLSSFVKANVKHCQVRSLQSGHISELNA